MAGNLPYHPAPGLENGGSLPAGFYAIPNTRQGIAQHGVKRVQGIAEIIPGSFSVPQNPVTAAVTGSVRPLGQGSGSCTGSGSINGIKVQGVGDISADLSTIGSALSSGNFTGALSDTVMGIPLWGILAGLAFVMFMDTGSGSVAVRGKRAARAAARAY